MAKTKVFVDGNCIVCDTEISRYQRMAPDKFEIVDISAPGFNAADYSLTPEAVNKHMHLLTPEGDLKIGVDAFAHIWSQLPKYQWAAKLIKLPGIHQLAKVGYVIFASNRHLLPKRKKIK